MQQDLTRSAIEASLSCNWEEAIDYNIHLLASDPDNIAALNRLARAYTELNQKSSAKEIYERVLKLDKYNRIALRSLHNLPDKNVNHTTASVKEDFIEEPGTTRCIKLTKLAAKEILLTLTCQEPLSLVPRARLISITRDDNTYIGSLPDDLSLRLQKLLKSGYGYRACVKTATDNSVTLFLRELKRPNRLGVSPSFSPHLKLKELKKR